MSNNYSPLTLSNAPDVPEAFVTYGTKWGTSGFGNSGGVVTWSLMPSGLSTGFAGGSGSVALSSFLSFDYGAQLERAFNAWSAVANVFFSKAVDGGTAGATETDTDIRITGEFIDGSFKVAGEAYGPNANGGSQSALSGNIRFDTGDTWDSERFFRVALHEIGHAIGLSHESSVLAIMNPQINPALTGLQPDDINGVVTIYGAANGGGGYSYTMPESAGAATLTLLTPIEGAIYSGNAFTNVIVGTSASETMNGGNGADVLLGAGGADVLNGNDDNDVLKGDSGGDYLFGNNGADQLEGGSEGDSVVGGTGDDVIYGEGGGDYLFGDDGNDYEYGGDDGDYMLGGNNEDWMQGGNGADMLYGQAGSDVLIGDAGGDYLIGDDGNDVLKGGDDGDYHLGGNGGDYVEGGNGGDMMYGGAGDDVILGGAGNDVMTGESGNDQLYGGAGDDRLYGGAGIDQFVYQVGLDLQGVDTIVDFQAGAGGDYINLDTLLGNAGYGGNDPVAAGYVTWGQAGSDTRLMFDLNGGADDFQLLIVLQDVNAGQLSLFNNLIV